jgi:hypothetical protein
MMGGSESRTTKKLRVLRVRIRIHNTDHWYKRVRVYNWTWQVGLELRELLAAVDRLIPAFPSSTHR